MMLPPKPDLAGWPYKRVFPGGGIGGEGAGKPGKIDVSFRIFRGLWS